MKKNNKETDKDVEGGSPSRSGPRDETKHEDESKKSPGVVEKDAIQNSEQDNMTDKEGYNETPPTVPVKSSKKTA